MKIIPYPLPRNKNAKYKRISDKVLEDNRLSAFARLFFILLVNWDKNPNASFRPNITFFAKRFNVSNRKIDRAACELRKYGYLQTYGKKEKTIWEIHEVPIKPIEGKSKTTSVKNVAHLNVNNDANINVKDDVVTYNN